MFMKKMGVEWCGNSHYIEIYLENKMKKTSIFLFLFIFSFVAAIGQTTWTPEMKVKALGGPRVSPDGKSGRPKAYGKDLGGVTGYCIRFAGSKRYKHRCTQSGNTMWV